MIARIRRRAFGVAPVVPGGTNILRGRYRGTAAGVRAVIAMRLIHGRGPRLGA